MGKITEEIEGEALGPQWIVWNNSTYLWVASGDKLTSSIHDAARFTYQQASEICQQCFDAAGAPTRMMMPEPGVTLWSALFAGIIGALTSENEAAAKTISDLRMKLKQAPRTVRLPAGFKADDV